MYMCIPVQIMSVLLLQQCLAPCTLCIVVIHLFPYMCFHVFSYARLPPPLPPSLRRPTMASPRTLQPWPLNPITVSYTLEPRMGN